MWAGYCLFSDSRRQQECSTHLASSLGHEKHDELYFEAGTFAHLRDIRQQVAIHLDTNSDGSDGYEFAGVASFIVNIKYSILAIHYWV